MSWSQARGAEFGVVVALDRWVNPQHHCIPKGFGVACSWRSQIPPGPAGCRHAAEVLPGAGVPGVPHRCRRAGPGSVPRSAHAGASKPCEG